MNLLYRILFLCVALYAAFHAGRYYEHKTNPPLVIIEMRTVPLYVFTNQEEESARWRPKLFIKFSCPDSLADYKIDSMVCSLNVCDRPSDTAFFACYDEPDSLSNH